MKRSRLFKGRKEDREFEDAMSAAVMTAKRGKLPLERDVDIPSSEDEDERSVLGSESDDDSTLVPSDLEEERKLEAVSKAKLARSHSDFSTDSSDGEGYDGDSEYAKGAERKRSIVKVSTTASRYDYVDPHVKSTSTTWNGSGTVIKFAGKLMILTNAHVVDDFRRLQVRKSTDARKFTARAVNISSEADLALLEVVEAPEEFFDGVKPIEIAFELPVIPAGKRISVKGFPMGGAELSETFGRVSRVEVSEYVHRGQELLQVQVDAAINPGNSGGPCFYKDKLCGVAFQGIGGADNLGYIIPNCVVEKFLHDSLKPNPLMRGFPEIPISTQDLENSCQRETLGMRKGQSGILVLEVAKLYRDTLGLKSGDVVLEINGKKIHNDSSIDYEWLNHVDWTHEIAMADVGDKVAAKVLRDGKELEVEVSLDSRFSQTLMTRPIMYNRPPTYLIESGFQFTPVCQNNILGVEEDQSYKGQQIHLASKEHDDDEIIYISNVFAHDLTNSFDRFQGFALKKVNDVEVKNMVQLKEILDALAPGDKIKYELCNKALIHMRKFSAEEKADVAEHNDLDGVADCSRNLSPEYIEHYFAMQVDPRARVTKGGGVVIAADYDYHRGDTVTLDLSVSARSAGLAEHKHKGRARLLSSSRDDEMELERELVLEGSEDNEPKMSKSTARRGQARKPERAAKSSRPSRLKRSRRDEDCESDDSMGSFIVDDGDDFAGLASLKGGADALDTIRQLSMSHRAGFMTRLQDRIEDEGIDDDFEPEEEVEVRGTAKKRRKLKR